MNRLVWFLPNYLIFTDLYAYDDTVYSTFQRRKLINMKTNYKIFLKVIQFW